MIEVNDWTRGPLRGKSLETIAQRVYGRRAWVQIQDGELFQGVKLVDVRLRPKGQLPGPGDDTVATWTVSADAVRQAQPDPFWPL